MSLLTDPEMRARVLSELGGEAALLRWERLKARMKERLAKPVVPDATVPVFPDEALPLREHGEGEEEVAYKPRRARTDSRGEFCLAPIPRGAMSRPRFGLQLPRP